MCSKNYQEKTIKMLLYVGICNICAQSMFHLTNYTDLDISNFLTLAMNCYPQFNNDLQKILFESQKNKLWKEGHAWYENPKDFKVGERIFLEILKVDPNDYWAILSVGGCKTWNKEFVEGEHYIRKALDVDPTTAPNAYTLLAQNLIQQGKHSQVRDVITKMLSITFPSVATVNDHKEKLLEGLECLHQVEGLNSPIFKESIQKAKKSYQFLDAQLSHLEKTGKRDENCHIM